MYRVMLIQQAKLIKFILLESHGLLILDYPKKFQKLTVEKGSIAINGVSLTISKVS